MKLKNTNSTFQILDGLINLDYTLTIQSSLHVCGFYSMITVYLNKLFSNSKIDVNNSNFVKLEASNFTIDVASESEVLQSHITQIRKKTSSNFQVNIDDRPQV